jgi:chromosome segregation ATPase
MKRRLQEAEEEQYKAEEDAAALRAEIKMLQASEDQSESLGATAEQLRLAEQHNNTLQKELQEVVLRLQQEQQRVSMERQRAASLNAQNQDLQNELLAMSAKLAETEEAKQSRTSVTVPFSEAALADSATSKDVVASEEKLLADEKAKEEKSFTEEKLRELANMVERQESGRQKLLAEIDKQSLEIERLFVENEGLRESVKQTTEIAARWEAQVQDCIQQNNELRTMLNQLRLEQSSMIAAADADPSDTVDPHADAEGSGDKAASDRWNAERTKLKIELAKALAKSEELSAQLAQQSADLNRAVQAYTSLSNLYKPVFSTIENRLMKIRQESPDVVFAGM